jgi:hypothetical protein
MAEQRGEASCRGAWTTAPWTCAAGRGEVPPPFSVMASVWPPTQMCLTLGVTRGGRATVG